MTNDCEDSALLSAPPAGLPGTDLRSTLRRDRRVAVPSSSSPVLTLVSLMTYSEFTEPFLESDANFSTGSRSDEVSGLLFVFRFVGDFGVALGDCKAPFSEMLFFVLELSIVSFDFT